MRATIDVGVHPTVECNGECLYVAAIELDGKTRRKAAVDQLVATAD